MNDSLPFMISTNEYNAMWLVSSTHTAYNLNGNAATFSGLPTTMTGVAAGAHDACAFNTSGQVWCKGDNPNGECGIGTTGTVTNMTQITTDSLGNAFNNVVMIDFGNMVSSFNGGEDWTSLFLKGNGTVWIAGCTLTGGRGIVGYAGSNTANTRPVQIQFPNDPSTGAPPFIVKIQCGYMMVALASNGGVWTWGGDNSIFNFAYFLGQGTSSPQYYLPTKITLPVPIVDIAGAGCTGNYYLGNNGRIYCSTPWLGFVGAGTTNGGGTAYETPPASTTQPSYRAFDLTDSLKFSHPIRRIWTNNLVTYAILTDSTLHAWGDNVCGGIGNGIAPNYAATSPVYHWNISPGNSYNIITNAPYTICPGTHNWVAVFTGNSLSYDAMAEDANGRVIALGRNKGGVSANSIIECDGIAGNVGGSYDVSWLIKWPQTVSPVGGTTHGSTCPFCIPNPSGFPCNSCTNPSGNTVTARVTATYLGNNQVKLDASSSTSNQSLYLQAVHTPVSCTGCQMGTQGDMINTITVPGPGTYTTQATLTDTYWVTNSAQVTFTVPPSNVISFPTGSRIIIH